MVARKRHNIEVAYQTGRGKQKRDLLLCQIGFEDAAEIQKVLDRLNPDDEAYRALTLQQQEDLSKQVMGDLRHLVLPHFNEMMESGQAEVDTEWLKKYVPSSELGYIAGVMVWGTPKDPNVLAQALNQLEQGSGQSSETSTATN